MQSDRLTLSKFSQAVSQLREPSLQRCFTVDVRSGQVDSKHAQGFIQALSRCKDAAAQHSLVQLARCCPRETVDRLGLEHQFVHKLAIWLRASRSTEFELDVLHLLARLKVPVSLARREMLVQCVRSVHHSSTGKARSLASELLETWNVEASEAAAVHKSIRCLEQRPTHVSLKRCLHPPTWRVCLLQGSDGIVCRQEHGSCSRKLT